jgi:hypothetical protein
MSPAIHNQTKSQNRICPGLRLQLRFFAASFPLLFFPAAALDGILLNY